MQSMTGYLDQETDDDKRWQHPVRVYGQFPPFMDRSPSIQWHRALFLYSDVADWIGDVVTKWFDSYETFALALDLYFFKNANSGIFADESPLAGSSS